jgi:transposase
MANSPAQAVVGLDISKKQLDIAVRPQGLSFTAPNTEAGIARLLRRLQKLNPQLIVLEATGGYEFLLVAALAGEDLPVAVVNPHQVREFARAAGRQAKTDKLDAQVLAHFGEAMRPEPRPLPTPEQQQLTALMRRRGQILGMILREKNRLEQTHIDAVRRDIRENLSWLSQRLKQMEKDIQALIHQSPLWREKDCLLQSVPGIGPVIARSLITYVPELGVLSGREVASLIGVAPFNRDSGRFKGKRMIRGGRGHVRSLLYMGALVASRFNEIIRDFYHRLLAAGKPKKLALTACIRKLLLMLNAMLKKQQPWQPCATKKA